MDGCFADSSRKRGELKALESWTGKANHCTQVLPLIRPMLQPLFNFISAAGSKAWVQWPHQVKAAMILILAAFKKKPDRGVRIASWTNTPAMSDGSGGLVSFEISSKADKATLLGAFKEKAKAVHLESGCELVMADLRSIAPSDSKKRLPVTEERLRSMGLPFTIWYVNEVGVGGWWLPEGGHLLDHVCWFSERVPREALPWVCSTKLERLAKGGCSSTTAELLALVVLLDCRLDSLARSGTQGLGLTISSAGDSAGCTFILKKMYTSAEPGASLMRYVASRCSELDVWTDVSWVPRADNEWADILSKGWEGGPRESERKAKFVEARRLRNDWGRDNCISDDVALMRL